LQRRLHLVALYWHPTISLSISFQLKRPTRPIEECSSLPTACICELSFPHSFRFRNISHWKQSLFAWCLSIMRRPISCGWISAPTLGAATSTHEGGLGTVSWCAPASHPCSSTSGLACASRAGFEFHPLRHATLIYNGFLAFLISGRQKGIQSNEAFPSALAQRNHSRLGQSPHGLNAPLAAPLAACRW
jgi:hypothetical protein